VHRVILLALACAAAAAIGAPAQTTVISTVAGGGNSPVGTAATDWGVNSPQGVAMDGNGNLYVAVTGSHQVWVVNSGVIKKVIGAWFTPSAVALDSSGNLYIADQSTNTIGEVSAVTGSISTIAGNGMQGYSGDSGAAIGAELNTPSGIAVDSQGNLYIADTGNNVIRKVTAATGNISTFAGNGMRGYSGDSAPAASAELNGPEGVTVDSSDNVYIADTGNNVIRRVKAANGNIGTIAGNGTRGSIGGLATLAELNSPEGVAVDSNANVYIADTGNNMIRKVTASTGKINNFAGSLAGAGTWSGDGGAATLAGLSSPGGVALDASGDLYIADTGNDAIREVSSGNIATIVGNGTCCYGGDGGPAPNAELSFPYGVAVDFNGNLYIADEGNEVIREVSAANGNISTVAGNGAGGYKGDNGPATSAELASPYGVAVDSNANVYIADYINQVIREVSAATGNISTVAGNRSLGRGYSGDGGPATSAGLNYPASIAVDSHGNLFIADTYNHRIREVSAATGQIRTVAGNGVLGFRGDGGPATSAELSVPYGVAVDSNGNLYIADTYNNRIREVSATTSQISTVAGNGTAGYMGDGAAATSAELNLPIGVAVDSNGNLFIADASNNVIREVSAATGIISTVAGTGAYGSSGDNGAPASAELANPVGVAVGSLGRVFVADTFNDRVRAFAGQAGPVITWSAPAPVTPGTALSATQLDAGANIPGTFAYTPTAGTVLSAGNNQTLSVVFTAADILDYGTATATTTINVVMGTQPQTITFGPPGNLPLSAPAPPLSANATSGLTVGFASNTTSVCTVSGTTVTLLTTGSCSITASQPGNTVWAAATPVTQTFTVSVALPTITSLTPNTGGGTSVTFQAAFSDANGVGDLSAALLQINTGQSGLNACYVYYQPQGGHLYLANNAGAWITPALTPGVAGTVSNSQCTLNAGSSSVVAAGNTLTLSVALTFTSTFVNSRNVYLYAAGLSGKNSGWVKEGVWLPNPAAGPPAIVSLSPNAGAGTSVTFHAAYSDPNGAADLNQVLLDINTSQSSANACYVYYQPQGNLLYLANNAGVSITPGLTPGAAGTASNSQCTLNAASSSVKVSGNNLTLNLALSFSSTFVGTQNVYLYASGLVGLNSGWINEGTWTPNSAGPPSIVSLSPNSGTGTPVTLQAVYSDPNGAGDLNTLLLQVNASQSSINGCYVYYQPQGNHLYLANNSGAWITPALTPGVAGTAANSQCTLNAGSSSVLAAGNNLTLSVALSFSGSVMGTQNVYLYAAGFSGLNSGWVKEGTLAPNTVSAPPSIVSLSPATGAGTSVTFQAVYADPNGAADLSTLLLQINTSQASANACYVYYQPQANKLYLANNAGNAWLTPALTPGVAGTASNNQCTLNAGSSSVATSGNNLTLTVALTFSGAVIGTQNVYMYAAGLSGMNSGWVKEGAWAPNPSAGPPAIVSLSPNTGSGTSVTFQAVYSDPNGAADLNTVLLQVDTSQVAANACYVYYQPQANLLYLSNNAGTAWLTPGLTPGVAGTASNSQCMLNAGSSSVGTSGNNLTLNAALTFSSTFLGAQNVYLYTSGLSGLNSGWVKEGTWTPNPSAGPPAIVSFSPNTGFGTSVTFQAVYSDPNGASDLNTVLLQLDTSEGAPNACYVYYQPLANLLYLSNNAGTAWLTPGLTPGGAGTVSNTQCTLNAGSSSVATSGNNLTLNVGLTFSGTFVAPQHVYLYAAGLSGQSSGWIAEGTWTP
jgi:trimeric autotransporter adhesin